LKITEYVFYADCHGLQSLVKLNPSIFNPLSLICMANIHRRPVYGIIELEASGAEGLLSLDPKESLKLIKQSKYRLPSSHKRMFVKNLEMIPNDILDPYYG